MVHDHIPIKIPILFPVKFQFSCTWLLPRSIDRDIIAYQLVLAIVTDKPVTLIALN